MVGDGCRRTKDVVVRCRVEGSKLHTPPAFSGTHVSEILKFLRFSEIIDNGMNYMKLINLSNKVMYIVSNQLI
jgi:hypothetical protein